MLATGFSRTETCRLTGLKPHQLSYLDDSDLVKPQKIGGKRKPMVLYSFKQVVELRTIAKLRDKVSLQAIRTAIKFLQEQNLKFEELHKCLIAFDNLVLLVATEDSELILKQLSGQNQGQILMSINLDDLLKEILVSGQDITDFNDRIADYLPQKVA